MMVLLVVCFVITEVFLIVKINKVLDRLEDNLVDIEMTYTRMNNVITYIKDCIELSNNQ